MVSISILSVHATPRMPTNHVAINDGITLTLVKHYAIHNVVVTKTTFIRLFVYYKSLRIITTLS